MQSTDAVPLAGPRARPTGAGSAALAGRLWRRVAGWAGRMRGDRQGRQRPMSLDPARVALLAALVVTLAAAAAAAWTWQHHERAAEASAETALRFVDRRLGAIEIELAQMARHVGSTSTLTACPDRLVAELLAQSLQSALVRRFDLVQVGSSLRCEPGGERHGKPLDERPPAGLSIVPGSPLSARPVVQRPLAGDAVLRATLDPYALVLPRSELPASLLAKPQRIEVHSPPAGVLLVRDSRPHPGLTGPGLIATARSPTHPIAVQVQVDRGDLQKDMLTHAALAALAALLLVALVVAWAWARTLARARLSNRLAAALRKRQFVPFVQPIVDLTTGRCVGAEVLMRWQHPHRGVIGPAEFIDEAERTGLIVGMSELVMARAAHRLAPLLAQRPELYFSFNVTPMQARHPAFAARLAAIFGPDTVPRAKVLLELTEREFVDGETARGLATLQAQGWRIAVDDFGTGHSSLAALEQLSIDRIKIDRAFVRTIDDSTVSRPVLDAVIALAGQLGVPLIAEGVETRSQWDYLAARGVRHAQGFLMARPMPIDAFADWLSDREPAPQRGVDPARHGAPAGGLVDGEALALWQRMRMPGGLDLRDRVYRLKTYRECFLGREAVDWLVQDRGVSRAEAVRIGQRLAAFDLIRHVHDEHDFEDAELFYRLVRPDTRTADDAPASEDLHRALGSVQGVAMRTRVRGLVRQDQCASGREIVDWIVRRYEVPRATARQWAAQLMRMGRLRHVFDDRPFRDDRTLYRRG